MIRCNLAVLLAEQNLKITKVSADTGISRTTLTSLSSNNAQGVQFDTLNTLCLYLKTTLNNLLIFNSIDIRITGAEKSNFEGIDFYTINAEVYEYKMYHQIELYGVLREIGKNETSAYSFTINMYSPFCEDFSVTPEITMIHKNFKSLPHTFKTDLENSILEKVLPGYDKDTIVVEWEFGEPDYLPF